MSRLRKALALGLLVATGGLGLCATAVGMRLEDDLALPWLFTIRGPVDPPSDVVVVSIDKIAVGQTGLDTEKWPPSRAVHARVVRALSAYGVSTIVMDIFFRVPRSAAEDDDLADAFRQSGRVTLFESVTRQSFSGGEIVQIRSPIEPLRGAAIAVGSFPLPDSATISFFWTFFEATAGKVPTLPAVALQIHGLPVLNPLIALLRRAGTRDLADLPGRVASVADSQQLMRVLRRELEHNPEIASRALALLDAGGAGAVRPPERKLLATLLKLYSGSEKYYLNFYGPPGRIRTIPFHVLMNDEQARRLDLKNKVVFVGEGAVALVRNAQQGDSFRTVYTTEDGVDLSGAEIAATGFANLLTDRVLERVPFKAQAAIIIGFGLAVALLLRPIPVRLALGAALALGSAYYGVAQFAFNRHALLLPLAVPLLVQLPAGLFVAVLSRYLQIRRQVPKEVDASASPVLMHGVCLSTDIENYSVVSEGAEPRELASLMNEYYVTLSRLIVHRHGLMVGRAGDSAMCVWASSTRKWLPARVLPKWLIRGRTVDLERRNLACLAAIEIRDAIDRFNGRHPTQVLRTRIGLHAGDLALGPVGGEYHVIGDTANAAARIEGLNKHLGTTILASEPVVSGLEGLCLRPVGRFLLPGRSLELKIVEVVRVGDGVDPITKDLCRRFAEALDLFTARRFPEAGRLFQAIESDYPTDGPTRYYRALCEHPAAEATELPVVRIRSK
jgi:adenylate cyclase